MIEMTELAYNDMKTHKHVPYNQEWKGKNKEEQNGRFLFGNSFTEIQFT